MRAKGNSNARTHFVCFCPFGSTWAEMLAQRADAKPFSVRRLSVWTHIRPKFGMDLRSHGQQTDAPHVRLVSALGPRVSHPTTRSGHFKCTRVGGGVTLAHSSSPSAPSRPTPNPSRHPPCHSRSTTSTTTRPAPHRGAAARPTSTWRHEVLSSRRAFASTCLSTAAGTTGSMACRCRGRMSTGRMGGIRTSIGFRC